MTATGEEQLIERVRERYAAAALTVLETGGQASCCDADCGAAHGDAAASCCGPTVLEVDETFGGALYSGAERDELPVAALAASLGCGNPTAVAELREGERVLDLGSGGGIDVLLSARRVGPTGFAYGVDMTDEMLELARGNATKAGAANVEFLKGTIEDVPLPDASIDVVISNCVINLSPDKPKVIGCTECSCLVVESDSAMSSRKIISLRSSALSAARTSAASPARSPAASTWHISLRPVSQTRPYGSPSRPPTACTAPSSKRRTPVTTPSHRKLIAEAIGTMVLVVAVIGSGIAAQRLSPGEVGLQLLENAVATGAALTALILALQPVSAAFNPIITLIETVQGTLQRRHAAAAVAAQVGGGLVGAVLANLMFGESAVSIAHTSREGLGIWLAEVVATAGLVIVIMGTIRSRRPGSTAFAVDAYIIAA
jgi:SAM-dependent methyltransferase